MIYPVYVRTMATLTLLIVVGLLCLGAAEDAGNVTQKYDCLYRFDIQPAPVSKASNLSSTSNGSLLTLCCQVSTEQNETDFSIDWHHSPTSPISKTGNSENNNIVTNSDEYKIETNETIINSKKTVWTKLIVTSFDQKGDNNYFWCSVNSTISNTLNISSVDGIPLQSCNCSDGPITIDDDSSLYCADNNTSIITIDGQSSNECSQENIETPSQPTRAIQTPTMFVSADNEREKNRSTTQEVTKSLTTTSTEVANKDTSTTHKITVEMTTVSTKRADVETTQATNEVETEWSTIAERSERAERDRIITIFIIGM